MLGTNLIKRMERNGGWWTPMDMVRRELENWMGAPIDEGRELVGKYPVDIHEDKDFVYVDAEMPGFKKEEVNVTFENGVLTITGERRVEEKKGDIHLTERRFTKVRRSFTLPNTVDEGKVEANLVNGVLHLKLHKKEEVKPRKIEIK